MSKTQLAFFLLLKTFSAVSPDFLKVSVTACSMLSESKCISYPNKILLWYSVVIDHVSLRQAPKCVGEVQVARSCLKVASL